MKVTEAIVKRTLYLLKNKDMTQYALCKKSAIPMSTLKSLLDGKTNDITLSNTMRIASGFDMTLQEFLDSDLFDFNNFENL